MYTRKKTGKNLFFSDDFYSDLRLDGMVFAAIVRSPVAKGKLISVDATMLPEGYSFFSAKDIPGKNSIKTFNAENSVFCPDYISYKGEPVGIVTGPDEETVHKIASSLKIFIDEYDEPPPSENILAEREITVGNGNIEEIEKAFEFKEKQKSETQKISEKDENSGKTDEQKNASKNSSAEDLKEDSKNSENSENDKKTETENTDTPDEEKLIAENLWISDIKQNFFLETAGAFCYIKNDMLNVYSPCLWVKHLRQNIALTTGFEENKINITGTNACERDSNSLWHDSVIICQACIACCKTKKPVMLTLSREEQNLYVDNSPAISIAHKTAVEKDGKFSAMEINIKVNCGAFNPFAEEILNRLVIACTNVYNCPNLKISGKIYKSATPPASLNLSAIDSQAFFAIENQINAIAEKTDFSPQELRLLNIAKTQRKSKMPFILNVENSTEIIQAVCKKSDFERKYTVYKSTEADVSENIFISPFSPPVRGIALSCAFEGAFYYGTHFVSRNISIEVTFTKTKKLYIHSIPPSPAILNVWKGICSKILEIEKDDILIDSNFDVSSEPYSPTTIRSNIVIMTQLLKKCCESIKRKKDDEFPVTVKKTFSPAQRKNWNDKEFCGQPFYSTSFAAAVVELELDTCTFREQIRGIWITVDAGKILSIKAAESSVKAAVQQALGKLVEQDTLLCPNITIQFLQSEQESKHIGDLVYSIIPAAYTSALSQALSVTVNSIPLKTDSLYNLRWKK